MSISYDGYILDKNYSLMELNKLLRHAFPFLYAIGRG